MACGPSSLSGSGPPRRSSKSAARVLSCERPREVDLRGLRPEATHAGTSFPEHRLPRGQGGASAQRPGANPHRPERLAHTPRRSPQAERSRTSGSPCPYYRCEAHNKRGNCKNALSVRESIVRESLLDEIRHRLASDDGLRHARKRIAEVRPSTGASNPRPGSGRWLECDRHGHRQFPGSGRI